MSVLDEERGSYVANKHICVAIYKKHSQADEAYSRLEVEGFDLSLLSFAGRDDWAAMAGSRHTKKRFTYHGKSAAFWERLWANLPGWGVFYFFENGPLMIAGSLVRTMVAAEEDEDEGNGHSISGGFGRGLAGIGIPEESITAYEAALQSDHILLFVFGAIEEVEHAQRLLNETKAVNHTLHHAL